MYSSLCLYASSTLPYFSTYFLATTINSAPSSGFVISLLSPDIITLFILKLPVIISSLTTDFEVTILVDELGVIEKSSSLGFNLYPSDGVNSFQ